MNILKIEGSYPLFGEVSISGSKNASLPIICAALMTNEEVVLKNVPNLIDVNILLDAIKQSGAVVDRQGSTVTICAKEPINTKFMSKVLSEMRASILLLGSCIGRNGEVKVSFPGGCKIGNRPHDQHIKGFNALGIETEETSNYIKCTKKDYRSAKVVFDVVTVTGTENILMASIFAQGETIILNAAMEPEIVDLANMLNKMGAKIVGAGTSVIKVIGVESLHGVVHEVISDRIEMGTFMSAVAGCGGEVLIKNSPIDNMDLIVNYLTKMGCNITIFNEEKSILIKSNKKIKALDIETQPYPGFPTDLQPIFMVLNSIAEGSSCIVENIYENRLGHANDLKLMGGSLMVSDKKVHIVGVEKLIGATVKPKDLRASAAMVLAGLIAEGVTTIEGLQYLDRGYEKIESKLSNLGAHIKRY